MLKKIRAGAAKVVAGISALFALAVVPAHAAVPTEASAAVTDLIADASTFIGSLWALLVAIVVGLLFMKIFKKGTSRAT